VQLEDRVSKFTDKMLADMRALIGTQLRTDAPYWTDPDHVAKSRCGTLIAPPSFVSAWLASVQVGWPGLGGFPCETRMSFERSIRVGDKVTAKVIFDGFDGPIDDSQFGGRRIKDNLL